MVSFLCKTQLARCVDLLLFYFSVSLPLTTSHLFASIALSLSLPPPSLFLSISHTHLQQWQKHFFVLVKTGKLMFTEQQEREEIDVEKDDEPEVACDL